MLEPPPFPAIPEIEEPQEPKYKNPRTTEQYSIYKDGLLSAKIVNNYIHKKSIHQEIEASTFLAKKKKKETTKVTLHFNSKTRSRIEGEWPCMVLNVMDKNPDNCHMTLTLEERM